jgi:hypothetical protein
MNHGANKDKDKDTGEVYETPKVEGPLKITSIEPNAPTPRETLTTKLFSYARNVTLNGFEREYLKQLLTAPLS